MGIKITAKVTKKGNLKIDDLARELLDLKPDDKVIVKIKRKESGGDFNENLLHIPCDMLDEAGIDGSNGLISYVEGNSIVIVGADEDENYE